METITGGCLCGAVRYTATTAPIAARICWCRLCQYLGAGSGTANVIFPREAVSITGELTDYASIADSGTHMHRQFCPRCGTSLGGYAEERAHLLVVRIGTLDNPELMKPSSIIWASAAPSWAAFDPALPCVAGQPPPVG